MNRNLKNIVDHQLSTLTWREADSRAMMDKLKGTQSMMKRKVSGALVFALVMMLALSGIAVAASLGAFGSHAGEDNAQRLDHLDAVAADVGTTVTVSVPEGTLAPAAQTLYDEICAYQSDNDFTLTLDKAYTDGNKLYYAYTFTTKRARQTTFGEGKPSGFDAWDSDYTQSGVLNSKKLTDYVTQYDAADDAAFHAWFDPREEAYAVSDYMGVGDGCRLADGRSCNIFDSGETWLDAHTLTGFQEVKLPENAAVDGKIDFVMSIGFGTAVYYQSPEGAFRTNINLPWPENIIKVPMSVKVTGSTVPLSGSANASTYTAKAALIANDVEIFGTVTLKHAQTDDLYALINYDLVLQDGTVLKNLDGALKQIDAQTLEIGLRYDLPANLSGLVLRPQDAGTANADICID